MRRLSILIIVLIILAASFGCNQSQEEVIISSRIEKYTPLMSSVQGIPLTATFKSGKVPPKAAYIWTTESGQFLWDGKELGKETDKCGEKILWVVDFKATNEPAAFFVKLKVMDPDLRKEIAKGEIQIEKKKDGFYYVVK